MLIKRSNHLRWSMLFSLLSFTHTRGPGNDELCDTLHIAKLSAFSIILSVSIFKFLVWLVNGACKDCVANVATQEIFEPLSKQFFRDFIHPHATSTHKDNENQNTHPGWSSSNRFTNGRTVFRRTSHISIFRCFVSSIAQSERRGDSEHTGECVVSPNPGAHDTVAAHDPHLCMSQDHRIVHTR